jgi:hypothetical protein
MLRAKVSYCDTTTKGPRLTGGVGPFPIDSTPGEYRDDEKSLFRTKKSRHEKAVLTGVSWCVRQSGQVGARLLIVDQYDAMVNGLLCK